MTKNKSTSVAGPVYDGRRIARLHSWASALVEALQELDGVTEGSVLYGGTEPPYRRIDCDRRVLAYVRVRARRSAVRIDITGRWRVPPSRLEVPSSSAKTLLVRSDRDLNRAISVLRGAVTRSRRSSAGGRP